MTLHQTYVALLKLKFFQIPPPGNHNTIEIEFVSPNDFIFVQQSILQPVVRSHNTVSYNYRLHSRFILV